MTRSVRAAVSCLLVFMVLTLGEAQGADSEAGRRKAAACASCHGKDGMAVMPLVPNLAGQSALYLVQQLQHFRDGRRTSEVMGVVVRQLSDADLEDIAAFYESLPPCGK